MKSKISISKIRESNTKLSLAECRKAVAKDEIKYTDEELIKIRDWFDNMADIILAIIEKNGLDEMDEIMNRELKHQEKNQ